MVMLAMTSMIALLSMMAERAEARSSRLKVRGRGWEVLYQRGEINGVRREAASKNRVVKGQRSEVRDRKLKSSGLTWLTAGTMKVFPSAL
jgi:hypothetical protein